VRLGGRFGRVGTWVVLCLVCALVTMAFFTPSKSSHQGINSQLKFSFVPSIKGWACKPFIYRALVPQTIAGILKLFPDQVEQNVGRRFAASGVTSGLFARLKWETDYALAYLVCVIMVYMLFLFFSICASKFVLETTGLAGGAAAHRLLGAALLLGLPPFFKFTSFLYDPAQLFLFTTSMYLIYRRRWRPYLVFFALTCLNKETAILLVPIFVFHYPAWPLGQADRQAKTLLAAQAGIFVVAKALLALRFRENPGPFMEFHLLDHNLNVLAGGYGWSSFLLLALLGFVVLYRWREKPAFLRTAFLSTLPPMIVIYLFVGWIDEWRVYYEAYPVVFAMALDLLRGLRS
jgi:hypothetical protein